jgi:hypothetical protein
MRLGPRLGAALCLAATMATAAVYHGALGTGDAFTDRVDTTARRTLDYYELPAVQARMQRGPLTRRIILSGPADSFQRAELIRIMDNVPGVIDVKWDPASKPVDWRRTR